MKQHVEGNRIAEALETQGQILSVPVGISMWPMLRNRRDHIVIKKLDRPLRKYDVPMYRRPNGQYVLHRIIRIGGRRGQYVICGDNLWRREYEVTDSDIIGILVGFFRGEKYIDCEKNRGYRCYVYVWRFLYPLRACLLWSKEIFNRCKRKLIKRRIQ